MGSRIQRNTYIYLATLIAGIALSGCGEKKEVRGTPPPEAPKSTATVEEAGASSPMPLNGQLPSYLKDPLDEDSGYEPVDPRAIESTDFEKRYTGMQDPEGLLYTGSSTDRLLTYLRLRSEDANLGADRKSRNVNAAQGIRSARLSRDPETGDVVIALKIKEGQNLKNYVLTGGLSEGDAVNKLRLANGSRGLKTTGSQNVSGKIRCLDEDGGCETMVAQIVLGDQPAVQYPGTDKEPLPGGMNPLPEPVVPPTPDLLPPPPPPIPLAYNSNVNLSFSSSNSSSSSASVVIVFRESLADIRASLSKSSGNSEYETIRNFWINSHYESNVEMKLKKAVLKSFEIVNGRSGFEAQIIGENRQLISLGGPLLAPDAGTAVNITADRDPQLQESLDLDGMTGYKFDLSNYIGSAKIVNNNGLGQVRIALKMRKRVGYTQESFRLTLMRIIKPTLEPNEDNLNLK